MAILIIPTDHSTLSAAVAAASNGDTIILEDGTHNVPSTITTSRTRLKIIARNPLGARITCNTTIFSGSLDRWEFHDLYFEFGSSTSTRLTSSNGQCSLFRCTFDWSARVANSSVVHFSMALANNRHLTIRGCRFVFNPAVRHGRMIYFLVSGVSPAGAMTVESCIFEGYNASPNQPIRIFGIFGQCVVRVRNNTFKSCVAGGSSYASFATNCQFASGSTLEATNNIIEDQQGSAHVNFSFTDPGDDTWQVVKNVRYHTGSLGSFATAAAWVNESGSVTATSPTLDSDLVPLPNGPALWSGDSVSAAKADYHRRSYTTGTAPSRGAVEYYLALPRLHVQWVRIPFGGGLSMTILNSGSHAVTFPSYTWESFASPVAVARALTLLVAINAPTSGEEHGFEAIYSDSAYRWHSSLPIDFTVSGASAYLFGAATWSSATSGTLSTDPQTVDSPYLLDEEALGEEMRAMGELSGVGRPIAALREVGGERWVFKFGAITPAEDPRQHERTAGERLMGAFHAGGTMRVWRSILNDDPWDMDTNPLGYSDIVTLSGGDTGALQWYDTVRRRFDLEIEGVEVR